MRLPHLQLKEPLWLTLPRQALHEWQSPSLLPETSHTMLRRAYHKELWRADQSKPSDRAESLLYLQSSPFTPQVPSSPKAHHTVYTYTHQPLFPLVYCVTLQRNESEQSRTSAHSRQGDTHCPLNWKYQCNLFSSIMSQSTKFLTCCQVVKKELLFVLIQCLFLSQARNQAWLHLPGPNQPIGG